MTNSTHYETYRCRKLTSSLDDGTPTQQLHPLAQLEREGAEHLLKVDRMPNVSEDNSRLVYFILFYRLKLLG